MTSLLAEVKDVLRPFAEFIRWSDAADGDEIINWHSNQGVGRRRITVGNLRAVKALLSRLEAQSGEPPRWPWETIDTAPSEASSGSGRAEAMAAADAWVDGYVDRGRLQPGSWNALIETIHRAFLSGRRSMQEEAAKVAAGTAADRIRALTLITKIGNPETNP